MYYKVVVEELGIDFFHGDPVADQQADALVEMAQLALKAKVDLALLRQLLAEDAQLSTAAEVVVVETVSVRILWLVAQLQGECPLVRNGGRCAASVTHMLLVPARASAVIAGPGLAPTSATAALGTAASPHAAVMAAADAGRTPHACPIHGRRKNAKGLSPTAVFIAAAAPPGGVAPAATAAAAAAAAALRRAGG